ncbi:MAG: sigma-70 family RNA polymerase sigma factor [Candidatus Neomarinimicrobiota bacterium]
MKQPDKRSKLHSALNLYLEEIKNLEPLTPEQEVQLTRQARAGDNEAFRQIILHNLRFVVMVAKKHQSHGLQLEDMINEGNLGLIKAVQRFDETRGFKFISYAVWWIDQAIRQAIAKNSRVVRLPANVSDSISQLQRRSMELEQAYEREPTMEELASIAEKTIGEVEDLFQVNVQKVSLDAPMDDSDATLLDFVSFDNERPEAQMMRESLLNEIEQVLHTLDSREEYVVRKYFGLGKEHSLTLEDIGKEMGLTRERVRQIKEKALQRLRHNTRSHLLRIYIG